MKFKKFQKKIYTSSIRDSPIENQVELMYAM